MGIKTSNEEIKSFIDEGAIIVLDTCFWLDIYRNLPENILPFIDVLNNQFFYDKLHVPYYVKVEFEKNYQILQNKHKKLNDLTKKSLIKIVDRYSQDLNKEMDTMVKRYHIKEEYCSKYKISSLLEELKKEIDEFIEDDEITDDLAANNVSDEVKNTFDNFFAKNPINTMSKDAFVQCVLDGEKRYESKTPPGYKDADKSNRHKFIFGDLLIWMDVIHFARNQQKNVLFVTNDVKEDWFEDGCFHSKLINEFENKTKQKIIGIAGKDFIDFMNYLKLLPGKILGGIDSYIENHINEIARYVENDVQEFISELIMDENSEIYNDYFLTGYDGEYFDCDGDVDIKLTNSKYKRYGNLVEVILEYQINYLVTTASYSGKDDETGEVYLSPYRTHKVQGEVEIGFDKMATEFYSNLCDIGEIELHKIVCKEIEYEDKDDGYYDDQDYPTNSCPDCGEPMTDENYGGNGFCIHCAYKH